MDVYGSNKGSEEFDYSRLIRKEKTLKNIDRDFEISCDELDLVIHASVNEESVEDGIRILLESKDIPIDENSDIVKLFIDLLGKKILKMILDGDVDNGDVEDFDLTIGGDEDMEWRFCDGNSGVHVTYISNANIPEYDIEVIEETALLEEDYEEF